MRQSIGATWVLQLVILFILLFVGYIILTLNYSKTIKIKNETISMIEKYEGLNEGSVQLINNYLQSTGYSVMGKCNNESGYGVYGALDLDNSYLVEAEPGVNYYYCVKKYKGANTTNYYQIALFYKFNLPVIGDTSSFTIKGTTTNFQPADDSAYSYTIDGSY